jgi:regulator of sigma E protease
VLTVVLGLAVLSVLVIFHEYGHFWAARWMGVRVERFSIGFGPVVLRRRVGEVEYVVSAFPLGGYVKMGGDDPRNRDNLQPGDLFYAAWWRRIIIALAGPGANFILAIILSITLLWVGVRVPDAPNRIGGIVPGSLAADMGVAVGDNIVEVNGAVVNSLQEVYLEIGAEPTSPVLLVLERDSVRRNLEIEDVTVLFQGLRFPVPAVVGEVGIGTPAYKSGMVVGDSIIAVGGEPISNFSDLQRIVSASAGEELVFGVVRDGRTVEFPITPFKDTMGDEPVGKIGVAAASVGTYLIRLGFLEGIQRGTESAVATVGVMFSGIISLFSDASNLSQISGPVAIIQASGEAARAGLDRLLDRAILFSIALMVFNLLPIPILDGGMVMLSLLEGILRRPVGEKGLAVYQGIGLAVMGTLIVFVLINDPLRILQRRSALGRIGDLAP